MANSWTRSEVEAAIADYFVMYEAERQGESFNKAWRNRELRKRLRNRSKQSVELKHQNISAAMVDHGLPYLPGYVPMPNYQRIVFELVGDMIAARPDIVRKVAIEVDEPVSPQAGLPRMVNSPIKKTRKTRIERMSEDLVGRIGIDYLAREASNRALGLLGEQTVVHFEIDRLERAGRSRLAQQVAHVSTTRGDGLGFDVLSFEVSGQERFIEVKTTNYGIGIPFYVTRGEVAFSERHSEQFQLYRVFDMRRESSIYALRGALERTCALVPINFKASVNQ